MTFGLTSTPPAGDKPRAPQILLVDDNATNLQVLYQTLEGNGYRLLAARSGLDAISIAQRAVPELILLDVMMPDIDGFETCARLKADPRTRECAVIFLSALSAAADKVRGLDLGAVDFINKPFQAEEVLARVRTHLTIRALEVELRQRNQELQHELTVAQELLREARDRNDGVLLGNSAVVTRLRQDIQEAAASDETLLISGPPGSDHEAVARAVHHESRRAPRPIIRINCAAVPADGSPSSVLTGGTEDFAEKVRLAHGGTLYLEGIQHLRLDAQRFLASQLRTLEEARRAPGRAVPDVRVILSTTRDIDEEVAAGRILPDLHRLLAITVDIAPLRARNEDIPALAPHILRRQAEQSGRTVPILSEDSLKRMQRYRWPGNLRELRNVLGSALAVNHGPVLEVGEHLLDNSLRVGGYSLIERLGSGGMGEVWLGRHQLLARPAAIKIVRDTVGTGEDGQTLRQRFAREARATAELHSPHTVQLFDFGIADNGTFYYVMELLRGMDLQRLVKRHGPQPPERVVFLLKQACRSLAEAHAMGLVHRDIKPANLFVCRLGREYDFLKVLDFGVVSRTGQDAKTPITVTGLVLGTPAFLAPELGPGQGPFDRRADIYALGCVAFWLLTGRPPFEAEDPLALLMHHSNTPAPAPSTFAEEPIPGDLDALVTDCLSKNPSERPASADVLWERLDKLTLPGSWDQRRARTWWEQHEPELVER